MVSMALLQGQHTRAKPKEGDLCQAEGRWLRGRPQSCVKSLTLLPEVSA